MHADPRGAYYTPSEIVSLIVENTVGRLCRESADPSRLAVLDSACGAGAFLLGARDFLTQVGSAPTHLYGADVDEVALEAARGCLGECADLVHGDSLLVVDWRKAFPDIMARGGFDAVIGNPPWVSLGGRFGLGAYTKAEVERLRGRFGGNSYLPNTFEYFISLGLELTRPGGYFSFIVPDRLGFNRQFEYLRRRLLAETELLLLVHGIPFPGVVADTLVFVCRKGAPGPDTVTEIRDWRGASSTIAQSEMLSTGCEFRPTEDPRITRIIRQMESLPGRLGGVCEITSGFGGRSELITDARVSDAQIPVLKGDSIKRYAVRKRYWFEFRAENLTGRTRDPAKLGASPKILIRKTGSQLIAAYDDSGMYPEQSLYFLFNKCVEWDWRFILGVLNSRLMDVYYKARCLTNPRTIAHAKIADLERIPFPLPDLSDPLCRALHDRLVSLAGAGSSSQDELDCLVCKLFGVDIEDLRAIIV